MDNKVKLMDDLKVAMKEKDTIRKNTIQMVRAQILQTEKDTLTTLDDNQVLELISKEVKKRNDSLVEFKKANRVDLIESTEKEIEVLSSYLPTQMSIDELTTIVSDLKNKMVITDKKMMGLLIKSTKEKVGLQASGKMISDVVKNIFE